MKINKNRLRALVREELSRSMKSSQRRLAEVDRPPLPDPDPEAEAVLSAAEAEAAREELRRFKMSVEDRLASQIDGVNYEGEQIPPLGDTDVLLMLRQIYNSADDGNKGNPVEVVFEDVVDGRLTGRGDTEVQESVTHLAWPARITVRYQPTNYDYQIGVRVQRLEPGPSGALQVGEVLPLTSGYMMSALNEPELQDEWPRGWGARYRDLLDRYDYDPGIRRGQREMMDQAYVDMVNRHFGYEEDDAEFLVLPLGQDNLGPQGHTGDFHEALFMYLASKGNSITVEVDTQAITDPERFAQMAELFGFTTVSNAPEEGTRAAEELFQSAGLE